jgi:hypothetical protein
MLPALYSLLCLSPRHYAASMQRQLICVIDQDACRHRSRAHALTALPFLFPSFSPTQGQISAEHDFHWKD